MAIPTLHPIITLKTVKLIKTHTNYFKHSYKFTMLYRSPPSEENVSLRTMGLPPAHLHLLGPFFD